MLIDQCSSADAANAHAVGVNLIVNESCPSIRSRSQLDAVGPHSLAVLPIADRAVRGSALAGWAFPDEPENNGWTPQRLRQAAPFKRGGADGLLSFITTSGRFYHNSSPPAVYGQFARLADVAGFDLYPLNHCTPDLSSVYDAQRAFIGLAGPMPTFQWIETGPIRPEYCGGVRMTGAELNAEVWLAIAGGARGIGYFTHTWTPDHHSFDVAPALVAQIARTNRLLAELRPALLGRTIPSSVNTSSVKILARRAGATTYVIAVNASRASIRMKFAVPGLRNGNVRVVGERRTVSASQGRVDDGFDPLGVHIYAQSAVKVHS